MYRYNWYIYIINCYNTDISRWLLLHLISYRYAFIKFNFFFLSLKPSLSVVILVVHIVLMVCFVYLVLMVYTVVSELLVYWKQQGLLSLTHCKQLYQLVKVWVFCIYLGFHHHLYIIICISLGIVLLWHVIFQCLHHVSIEFLLFLIKWL